MTSMNINSTENIGQTPSESWPWSFRSIVVLIICSLITILTILGNGIVLISVKFRLSARSYSDYFIVSLCLADFLVGLFVMPLMTVHSLYLRWPYHYRLCYIWMSIDFTCSTASFLTLASMALDRYWALTAPYFHLRNRSYSSVLIFIISSWAIPFAIWPGSIVIGHWLSTDEPSCLHPARPYIIVILCTFFYYIPLLFMLACYSRIIVNIKNIEVLIRDTWDSMTLNSSNSDLKTSVITTKTLVDTYSPNEKSAQTKSSSCSSLRSLFIKYFQRHRTRSKNRNSLPVLERTLIKHDTPLRRASANEHHRIVDQRSINASMPKASLSSLSNASHVRSSRQATTATFTGQKRNLADMNGEKRFSNELVTNMEEEQHLVRTRLSTRTSSLPAARCVSYYYYQPRAPSKTIVTKAIIENQHRDSSNNNSQRNSLSPARSRSQSHSSARCAVNGVVVTTDTDHSSSFDNVLEDDRQRSNRRAPPAHTSTSYNSGRYSQRAIAQFMHERHKARLRRNQKASRMLGILLAVFLVCWLPFTISYPTMIFYRDKFPSNLESIVFWFGYVNSLLNPFLYVYSSRNFRQAIFETVCCFVGIRSRKTLRYQWSIRAGQK